MNQKIPVPTITQFELFAMKCDDKIRIYLQNEFRSMGMNIDNPISFEVFGKWIYQDHNIYLNYSSFSISVATSLIYLDDIEFVDNLPPQQNQNSGNYNNMNRKLFFNFFLFNIDMPNNTGNNFSGGYPSYPGFS